MAETKKSVQVQIEKVRTFLLVSLDEQSLADRKYLEFKFWTQKIAKFNPSVVLAFFVLTDRVCTTESAPQTVCWTASYDKATLQFKVLVKVNNPHNVRRLKSVNLRKFNAPNILACSKTALVSAKIQLRTSGG